VAPAPPAPPPLDLAVLRTRFRDGKRALIAHFMQARATAPAASRLIKALTRHVDATLADLWQQCGMPASAALLAVGGYGRGELLPHSDVDVLLLLPDDASVLTGSPLKDTVESFITACWDIGLEIGSSVRNVAECVLEARADQTVQTSLLESRLVCGARKLNTQFQRETAALMDPKAFLRQDAGNAPAPHQVRQHALRAGTELQGKPRRPARPAGGDVGGACRRPGPQLGRTGRQRPDHAVRGEAAAAQ